jgi:hypothetical protein
LRTATLVIAGFRNDGHDAGFESRRHTIDLEQQPAFQDSDGIVADVSVGDRTG